jgi:hypothetical protein
MSKKLLLLHWCMMSHAGCWALDHRTSHVLIPMYFRDACVLSEANSEEEGHARRVRWIPGRPKGRGSHTQPAVHRKQRPVSRWIYGSSFDSIFQLRWWLGEASVCFWIHSSIYYLDLKMLLSTARPFQASSNYRALVRKNQFKIQINSYCIGISEFLKREDQKRPSPSC